MAVPDGTGVWGDKRIAWGTEAPGATGVLTVVCPFVPEVALACIHGAANIEKTKGMFGPASDISSNTCTFTVKIVTATGTDDTPKAATAAGSISYLIVGKG